MSQVRKFEGGGKDDEKTKGTASTSTENQTSSPAPVAVQIPGTEAVVIKKSEEPVAPTVTSHFIWDGVIFDNTEKTRKEFANFLASVSDGTGGNPWFDQIIKLAEQAEKEGGNVVYSTPSNTISFLDKDGVDKKIDWDNLNEQQDNRIQKERSWLGRFLDANLNSKVQRMAKDVSKLSGFKDWMKRSTSSVPAASDPAAPDSDLIVVDWGNNQFFSYLKDQDGNFLKDKNGNLRYDINNPTNAKLMRALTRAKAWLEASEDDRKLFQLASQYENGENLLSIYNVNPTDFKLRLGSTLSRITSGKKALPEDLTMLSLFGITPGAPSTEEAEKKQEDLILKAWTDAGYGDIYEKANGIVTLDENGDLVLSDEAAEDLKNYGISKAGGYELNDYWIDYLKSKGYYNPDLDWLNGFTLYNGKLYRTTSGANPASELGKILINSGFIAANKENLYADAQKIINTLWGNPYEWSTYNADKFSTFLWDPEKGTQRRGRFYRSANGMFTGLNPGEQIVYYFDSNAPRDYQGFVPDNEVKYMILDGFGNIINGGRSDPKTLDELKRLGIERARRADQSLINFGDDENTPLTQTDFAKSPDIRINNHTREYLTQDKSVAIYYNPLRKPNSKDGTSWVIYSSADLGGGEGYCIPAELAKLLLTKNQFGITNIEMISGNAIMHQKLNTLLQKIIDKSSSFWSRTFTGRGFGLLDDVLTYCGVSEDKTEREKYKEDILNFKSGGGSEENNALDKIQKQQQYKISRNVIDNAFGVSNAVQTEKQGGNIPKFKPGGGVGKAKESETAVKTSNNTFTDTRKSKEFAAGDLFKVWNELSQADKADLVGLGLDLGSIALGASPGLGGITGLAGTGAGLYADIKRDGFQLGDLGRAGLSAAFDIVSIIPGLGSSVQAAKTAAKIIEKAKPIMKILGAAGATMAIPMLDKLCTEGSLTAQEWHQLGVGLAGAINLARAGGPGKQTKLGDYKNVDVKSKVPGEVIVKPEASPGRWWSPDELPELRFTKAQIDELNAITDPLAKTAKAREFAFQHLKADPRFSWVSRADAKNILKEYNYSGLMEETKVPVKGSVKVKSTDGSEPEITLTKGEIAEIKASADPEKTFKEKIAWKLGERYPGTGAANSATVAKFKYSPTDFETSRFTVKSNIKGASDITLEKGDIETILSKSTPEEQQDAFIDIIKAKSGDDSLDSIDKIKDRYDINDFFEKRRGKFDWIDPWESIKKKDTFKLDAERETVGAPIRGNGITGAFGFRDWWHGNGTTPIFNNSRVLPTEADLLKAKATPTTSAGTPTPGVTTKIGTNWSWGGQQYYTPRSMALGNMFWKRKDYDAIPAPGYSEEDETVTGTSNWITYKTGGKLPKYKTGGDFLESVAESIGPFIETVGVDNLLDWGVKFPTNLANSRKQENISTELYKHVPMKTAVQYKIPGFYDNGITNQGNELIQGIYDRGSNVYTSDSRQTALIQNMRGAEATKYQHNINTNLSKAISRQRATADEYRNKNLTNAVTTENENRKQAFAGESAAATARLKRIQEQTQSFNNLYTDVVTKYRADKKAYTDWKDKQSATNYKAEYLKQIELQPGYISAKQAYRTFAITHPEISFDAWLIGAGASYKAAYDEASSAAKTKAYQITGGEDFSRFGWFQKEAEEYWNKLGKKISDAESSTASESSSATTSESSETVASDKKGGTITKKDPREELWKQQNKEAYAAIARLDKQTQQLLLKMLK